MSDKLILGLVSRQRLLGLSPIGVVDGREVFPIHGAEGDTDSADSSDDDESSDDDDSDEDGEESAKATQKRNTRGRGSDYNRMRRERNALLQEKQERERKDREAELKGRSEIDRATAERDDAVTARTTLEAENVALKIELGIIRASAKGNKYQWLDIEDVLNDKTLRKNIELDEDGELIGVEDALKELAKRKPHYLAKSSEDDDSGKGKGRQQQQQQGRPQGNGSTGGQPGSTGDGNQQASDRQKLNEIYPALQRLG